MNKLKTILVPTDFCVASLNTVRLALEQIPEPRVDVVLLHCVYLDDSITELLFYSPSRIIGDLMTDAFSQTVSMLTNQFENKLSQFEIKLFHGKVQCVFDTLLETLKIDEIYLSTVYKPHLTGRAFDVTPYIVNGVIPFHQVEGTRKETTWGQGRLENFLH